MNIRWSAAAAVIAASASTPYSHAFVSRAAATSSPHCTTATTLATLADAATPFFVATSDEQIENLQSQLKAALEEAAQWKNEYTKLQCRIDSNLPNEAQLQILEATAKMEQEKVQMQLDAIASIEEIRREFDVTMEESQRLIESLLQTLGEDKDAKLDGDTGDEQDDVSASEGNDDEVASAAITMIEEVADLKPLSLVDEEDMEDIASMLMEQPPTLRQLRGGPTSDNSSSDKESPSTKDSSLSNATVSEDAISEDAVSEDPATKSLAAQKQDLDLTRRVIMDFVMVGAKDDEDAFVLKKKNNVEYIEGIKRRAVRRMSLRERLASLDEEVKKEKQIQRRMTPRAPPRTVVPSTKVERKDAPSRRRMTQRAVAPSPKIKLARPEVSMQRIERSSASNTKVPKRVMSLRELTTLRS